MGEGKHTAITFQGAYALGVLRYVHEAEPVFRPSCVPGVLIGAFTEAIVVPLDAESLRQAIAV